MFNLDYENFTQNNMVFKNIAVISDDVIPDEYHCIKGDKKFDRFFYVVSGTIFFNKGTQNYLAVPAGTVVFLPCNITYVSEWDKLEQGEYISLNFYLTDGEGNHINLSDSIERVYIDTKMDVLKLFEQSLDFYKTKNISYMFKIQSILFELIYEFLKVQEKDNLKIANETKSIYKSILFLEKHFTENTSINELSDMSNVSETTFRRLFKKYKKISPIEYRTNLRMEKAKQLLQSGLYTISEIAYTVGYYDLASFSKNYKKHYGCSPQEHKKTL